MNGIKISVITINRNNAHGLEKTIQSVINQSYENIEYLLIDGASTDDSLDIVKNYSDHIHYFVSEQDKGIYDAMNKGAEKATGEYLLFLNSGDYLNDPSVVEEVACLINEEDVIYGDIGIYLNDKLTVLRSANKLTFCQKYQHNLPPQPAAFLRKDLFDKVGLFDLNYKIISDVVFFSRVFSTETTTYKHVDRLVTVYNIEGVSSVKESQELIYQERKLFISREFPQYLKDFEKIYHPNIIKRALVKSKRVFQKLLG